MTLLLGWVVVGVGIRDGISYGWSWYWVAEGSSYGRSWVAGSSRLGAVVLWLEWGGVVLSNSWSSSLARMRAVEYGLWRVGAGVEASWAGVRAGLG